MNGFADLMKEIWPLVLKDILKVLKYVPHALIGGCSVFAARQFIVKRSRRKGLLNEALILLLMSCIVLILFYTLYNRKVLNKPVFDSNWYGTWFDGPQGKAYLIENLIFFIPLGFLGGCLLPKKELWRCILFGFLFSLAIEALQYFWRLRLAEMSDLIMNTAGTVVGCLLAWFIP